MAAAVLVAGCTVGELSQARPATRPSAASTQDHLAAPASCPVTRPLSHATPPPQLHAIDNFTYYLHGWYGPSQHWQESLHSNRPLLARCWMLAGDGHYLGPFTDVRHAGEDVRFPTWLN